MHHIISDDLSLAVLQCEFRKIYAALYAGCDPDLQELMIQHTDYAQWQRLWLQGPLLKRQLEYWKGALSGAPAALMLPIDSPYPSVMSFRGGRVCFQIPQRLSHDLKILFRQEGGTMFMGMLAAFKVLLARWSAQQDIVVGSPISGRTHSELQNQIGFFVNTLVLRTDLSGDPNFRELLERVKATAMGAYAHQDIPFEKLVVELNPERGISRNPLFQVLFSLQNRVEQEFQASDLLFERINVEEKWSKFDLSLEMFETERGLDGYFQYSSDIFEKRSIEQLSESFETLLEAIVSDPERSVQQLSLLSSEQQRKLLLEWGAGR